MPAVFVHGVPDTHRVWRSVVGRLRRDDVVTLSLPGFDCEIPSGFDCSKEVLTPYAAPVFAKELEGHWS
jgi:pimeloyl-ACP methyl ester carboxylesterase